jgi:hypothetical protein
MHTFLLDLWHDLRAKRLWPIAGALLIAIAAVPFVLVQKAAPAPPPVNPPTQATTASDKLPTIQLDEISSKSPSTLNQFTQRNPFKPLRDIPKKAAKSGENQTVDLGASPKSDGSSGSGGGASASSASSDSSSGGSSGGSSGSTGGSTGSSGGSSSGGSRTIYYDYRTDIKFGLAGKAKAMKQVAAFTLLGDADEPAAMFMGVTDDHKWAVFTVDTARYEAQGEHECKPTPERCEFVYLKADDEGNETTLTTLDGSKSYDLTLTAIKRVILDKADVENVPTEDKSSDAAAKSRKTVDPEPRSWFDILAKKF